MSASSVAPDLSARTALRLGTRAAHERVDAAFARFDPSTTAGYRRFLVAHARAFLAAEAALDCGGAAALLPDWVERRRGDLLRADLADLGAGAPSPVSASDRPPGAAAAWGMIYVLEGSRFGGALIARVLPAAAPSRYVGAGANAAAWRRLVACLDAALASAGTCREAIAAANALFGRFEAAAAMEIGLVIP